MSGIVGSYFNTRGSGVVAKLGTDGQVFTSTGAGLTQGFEAAGGGDMVKIGSDSTTSTVDELKVEGFVDDAVYHKYYISCMNVIPETNAQDFACQLLDSSNNAITGTDYERVTQQAYMSASGSAGDSNDPGHEVDRWDWGSTNPHSSTASNMGGNVELWLSVNGTSWCHGVALSRTFASNSYYYGAHDYVVYDGGTAPTGIKCLFDSGGIESGSLFVYGIKL
jgi:hypothetical protein